MFKKIFKLYYLLNKFQKTCILYMLILTLLSSVLELLSITGIIYFINIISKDQIIVPSNFVDKILTDLSIFFGLEVIYFVGITIIVLLSLSNFFLISNHFFNSYFSTKITSSISEDLMKYYLNRKFVDHSADESSRILNNLTSLAYRVGHEIIEPTISLISRILFIIPIIIGMYLYNPKITLIGIIIFLFSYFIFFFFFRKIVEKFGKINTLNSKNKINLVEDFLGLFQDIKLNNLSFFYLNKLKKYNNTHIKINYVNSLISKSPKNIIEFIAFCVVIFLVIILYSRESFNFIAFVNTISVFVICIYKLLPSFQQVYMNIMTIKGGLNSFEYIKEDLIKSKRISTNYPIKQKFENKLENALIKKNSIIRFQNIDFNYQDSSSSGLKNINFSFKIGEKIALFGESGSGKTTLINIIAGLIKPNKGNIIIDEIVISEKNIKKFYKDVSFVPQDIHLINGSIKDNIILNKQKLSLIQQKKLKQTVRDSKLNNVISDVGNRKKINVGNKGSQLSGGQKQRVGIARALFKGSKIILFDESTNSLDRLTEIEIIKSFKIFQKEKSVIMITHNQNVLQEFDKIIFLEKGEMKFFGSSMEFIKNFK